MPAFWLNTEEGRKAFDEYRFAYLDNLQETHDRFQERLKKARFQIDMEQLQRELDMLEEDYTYKVVNARWR